MLNIFKKKRIIEGVKITAVRGKSEILLFYANTPEIIRKNGGIEIPNGYDIVTEVVYKF